MRTYKTKAIHTGPGFQRLETVIAKRIGNDIDPDLATLIREYKAVVDSVAEEMPVTTVMQEGSGAPGSMSCDEAESDTVLKEILDKLDALGQAIAMILEKASAVPAEPRKN